MILGQSISHTDRVDFIELLAKPNLKHINIYQTALSKNEYKLEIHPPLYGKYPPDALSGVFCEAR